jgi:hypothetical protein
VPATVRFSWSSGSTGSLQAALEGIAKKDVTGRSKAVRDLAKENVRTRSTFLKAGGIYDTLDYVVHKTTDGYIGRVGTTSPHAKWVEDGTGLYGPRHQLITPTSRRFMTFQSNIFSRRKPKPTTERVAFQEQSRISIFTPSTRGQRGKHYLRDALAAALVEPRQ